MEQALFESITGTFLDGTPLDSLPRKHRAIQSIIDNLNRIFNTRDGSIPHLKWYGLPDITEIYKKMPESIEELKLAIRKTIEKYEPRLKNIKVIQHDELTYRLRLIFILSGEIKNQGIVRFQTTFFPTGLSTISPWKKPV